MVKRIVLLVFLILITLSSGAANWYVDYSSGDDSKDGTTTNTAWKHCPGDSISLTGTVSTAIVLPGDIIHFKGGVSYVLTEAPDNVAVGTPCIIVIDGAAGNPVTYDGNNDGTWGIGRAILTDNYATNNNVGFAKRPFDDWNNINIIGFQIGPLGGSAVAPPDLGTNYYRSNFNTCGIPPNSATGIGSYHCMNNVIISNCLFTGIGYWFNSKPMEAVSLAGNGMSISGYSNLTIVDCSFEKVTKPLALADDVYGIGLNLYNCSWGNYVVWGISLPYQNPTAPWNNVFIHNNNLGNIGGSYATWNGYQCNGEGGPHQNGIIAYGAGPNNCGPNINVYNNIFTNNVEVPFGGTGYIFIVGNLSMNIFNNVFSKVSAQGAINVQLIGDTYYYLNIFNNTIYKDDGGHGFYIGTIGGGDYNTNYSVNIQNNIIYETNAAYTGFCVEFTGSLVPPPSVYNFDYNCYFSDSYNTASDGTPHVSFQFKLSNAQTNQANFGYASIPQLRFYAYYETNGMQTDPMFVSNGIDFHLLSNSPCISSGANLSRFNIIGLNSDNSGNPRPLIGPWDRGAYQYSTNNQIPSPTIIPVVKGFHIISLQQ